MFWQIIRFLISITGSIFFRRYKIVNANNLRTKGPVILALNHPNAFMDPILFALIAYPPKFYYMARGDAFNSWFGNYFLNSVGVVPIFRIQDGGKEGLKKNDETYKRVNQLLKNKKKIMVFAEGLCVQEKRLRPLKKGVARMVFGAMEEINDPDLIVVPVGLNYEDPKKFRGTFFINVGEPIRVADYMQQFKEQPARTLNIFIQDLEPKMKELIVHINDPANDKLVAEIEQLVKRDWCKAQGLDFRNLEHDHAVLKQIVDVVNVTEEKDPEGLAELREKSKTYFSKLNKLKIRDWLINPIHSKKVNGANLAFRILILVLFFPIYVRGLLGNYFPYKLAQKLTSKIAKAIEFQASFNLGFGSFLLLFFYILQFVIVYSIAPHIGWPFLVLLVSAATGLFGLIYHPFKQKAFGLLRTLSHKAEVDKLKQDRAELMQILAKFNKN